jgi:hypothetical protein
MPLAVKNAKIFALAAKTVKKFATNSKKISKGPPPKIMIQRPQIHNPGLYPIQITFGRYELGL